MGSATLSSMQRVLLVYENASSVRIISVFWFEENYEDADRERFLRLKRPL